MHKSPVGATLVWMRVDKFEHLAYIGNRIGKALDKAREKRMERIKR